MSVRLHEGDRDLEVLVGAEPAASRGRVVGVEGPAGIGKTSLLAAAGEAARAPADLRERAAAQSAHAGVISSTASTTANSD